MAAGDAPMTDAHARLSKGSNVEFFHGANPAKSGAELVLPRGGLLATSSRGPGPTLLLTHGWIEGVLGEDFDPDAVAAGRPATQALVTPGAGLSWGDKKGKRKHQPAPRRVPHVRPADPKWRPRLSVVLVRWGGPHSAWMDDEEPNEGDWGQYGSPPSDEYMAALVDLGVLVHPSVGSDANFDVEVLSLYVRTSLEVMELGRAAGKLSSILRGRRRAMFWMLWPCEWEDFQDPDYACYVERQALFGAMRACEAAGLPSRFPHAADQFEHITSKSWMATLSLHPAAHLPACTLVSKQQVALDSEAAAQRALHALAHVRSLNPFPAHEDGGPATLSAKNEHGIQKGVVKVGFSWENRFVLVFEGEEQLRARLKEMLQIPGNLASQCIVQEWVDFDFEMRLYFLPPQTWEPGTALEPTRVECNAWGPRNEKAGVGQSHASFRKLPKAKCLELWQGDEEAWHVACTQAVQTSKWLIAYLMTVHSEPVAMIRMDFMLRRLGPGKARVVFGEFCELGACCLGWREGPPTIWRAALDASLR